MQSFFILSAPRSGSTLLAAKLGVHAQIVMVLETFWFVAVSSELKRLQRRVPPSRRIQAMYDFLRAAEALDQLSTPPEKLREIVAEHQATPDRILSALAVEFAQRAKSSARIWGEKTPPHAFHVDAIERVFPDTRYIHLVRDPRANVTSIAKPSYTFYSNDWKVAAHLYLRFNQAIQRSLAAIPPERQMRIHYEALVRHPREELQRCCEFLMVEFDPAMLAHERFQRNLAGLGSVKAADALTGAFISEWKKILTPTQVRCIERFTSRLEIATYYEPSSSQTSSMPYFFTLAVLHANRWCLRLVEAFVGVTRGRPFVWSRLSLMLDRFLRRLTAHSRVLRGLMTSRTPSP